MGTENIEHFIETLKGAKGSYPFGPEALVYKVMGKMFALISQHEQPPRLTLKCKPADGEVLISQHESIVPGYHMNKRHWITISLDGGLPEAMLLDLIEHSYALVVSKLSRADKTQLEQT